MRMSATPQRGTFHQVQQPRMPLCSYAAFDVTPCCSQYCMQHGLLHCKKTAGVSNQDNLGTGQRFAPAVHATKPSGLAGAAAGTIFCSQS